MRIVCAPDSFKESISAAAAAEAMAAGAKRARTDVSCDVCPVGDGGEGTMDAIVAEVEWHARTPQAGDLSANRHGMGRELFAMMRAQVGTAEEGGSALFVDETTRHKEVHA